VFHGVSAGFGLLAACFLGLGWALQQHAAYAEPLGEMLHWRLIAHLLRRPLWLGGILAMVLGMVLAGLALDHADIARVEPILATNLVFALFFAHLIYREKVTRSEVLGAVLATGGVALFLLSGRPYGDVMTGHNYIRWLAAVVMVAAAIAFVLFGRGRSLGIRATLLATAAGMLYGVQDTLTRGSLLLMNKSFGAMLTSWEPYALVVVAAFGLLLTQSAFDAAPLQISLPATAVAEPVAGIVLGIAVFHEQLRITPLALAGDVAGLVGMVVGIIVLGRSPMLCKQAPCVPRPRVSAAGDAVATPAPPARPRRLLRPRGPLPSAAVRAAPPRPMRDRVAETTIP
jgi:drug/metabolite transporter (DMT)-like permease